MDRNSFLCHQPPSLLPLEFPLLTPAPGEACEPSQVIFSSPCCFSSLYLAKEALRPE